MPVGPEVSFFLVCDGTRALPIGSAQDHKRIFDDDRGPNTGGMGAFAPSPIFPPALQARVMAEVVAPVMQGMAAEGYPFSGFLYVGLMLTADGPKVIEFNARMGDPETQVVIPLIDERWRDACGCGRRPHSRNQPVASGTTARSASSSHRADTRSRRSRTGH